MAKKEMKKTAPHEPVVAEEVKVEEPVVVTEPEPVIVRVANCARLNLRKEPSTSAEVVTILNEHTRLELVSVVDDEWTMVKFHDKTGYVMSKYVDKE